MKGLYLVVSSEGVCMQDGFESYDEAVKWKDSAYMGYYRNCSIRPNPHHNSSFSFVSRAVWLQRYINIDIEANGKTADSKADELDVLINSFTEKEQDEFIKLYESFEQYIWDTFMDKHINKMLDTH